MSTSLRSGSCCTPLGPLGAPGRRSPPAGPLVDLVPAPHRRASQFGEPSENAPPPAVGAAPHKGDLARHGAHRRVRLVSQHVLSKVSTLSPDVHCPNVLREGRVVGMEVGIQGPRIILPSVQQDEGRLRRLRRLSLSLSGVSCIQGKVFLCVLCLTLRSSGPGLAACPDGSARPWNAPCWADPHLWFSLEFLPTLVGAGERGASALLECPGWSTSRVGGTLEKSPPTCDRPGLPSSVCLLLWLWWGGL